MKYSDWLSGAHCGLMFLPPVNAPTCEMAPVAGSSSARRYAPMSSVSSFVEKRSVANAIRWPSGDHAGCRSEYASAVSGLSVDVVRSISQRSVSPRVNAVTTTDRPSGAQLGLKISSTPGSGTSRSLSPVLALKMASAGLPAVTVAMAMRSLARSHAPAEWMNCRLE